MSVEILNSKLDKSVNFVEQQLVGFLESRFVRREDDYFVCYLSSQSGCNRGCKFCHLTVTGQTLFTDSTPNDFKAQALQVLKLYRNQNKPAKYVHFSFMARGEALANKFILDGADHILKDLGELALQENLSSKFCVSTIMPITLNKPLEQIFRYIHPTIYYSLYSVLESFRQKWMPGAMPADKALKMLKQYQDFSKKTIKIHFPFIKGENDSIDDLKSLCDMVNGYNLNIDFNLVRYNPFSEIQGEESNEEILHRNLEYLKHNLSGNSTVKIITRVGFDVKASCGMFVDKK